MLLVGWLVQSRWSPFIYVAGRVASPWISLRNFAWLVGALVSLFTSIHFMLCVNMLLRPDGSSSRGDIRRAWKAEGLCNCTNPPKSKVNEPFMPPKVIRSRVSFLLEGRACVYVKLWYSRELSYEVRRLGCFCRQVGCCCYILFTHISILLPPLASLSKLDSLSFSV